MFSMSALSIVVGVSGFVGFASLLAYLYVLIQSRAVESSVRRSLEGDNLFNADQVLSILSQFRDDDARVKALQALTHYDASRAQALLEKVKSNVDLNRLNSNSLKHTRHALAMAAVVFLSLAYLVYAFYKPPVAPASVSEAPAASPTSSRVQVEAGERASSQAPATIAAESLDFLEQPNMAIGMSLTSFRSNVKGLESWQDLPNSLRDNIQGTFRGIPGLFSYEFRNRVLVGVQFSAVEIFKPPADDSAYHKACDPAAWVTVRVGLEETLGSPYKKDISEIHLTDPAKREALKRLAYGYYPDEPMTKACQKTGRCSIEEYFGGDTYYSGVLRYRTPKGNKIVVGRDAIAFLLKDGSDDMRRARCQIRIEVGEGESLYPR